MAGYLARALLLALMIALAAASLTHVGGVETVLEQSTLGDGGGGGAAAGIVTAPHWRQASATVAANHHRRFLLAPAAAGKPPPRSPPRLRSPPPVRPPPRPARSPPPPPSPSRPPSPPPTIPFELGVEFGFGDSAALELRPGQQELLPDRKFGREVNCSELADLMSSDLGMAAAQAGARISAPFKIRTCADSQFLLSSSLIWDVPACASFDRLISYQMMYGWSYYAVKNDRNCSAYPNLRVRVGAAALGWALGRPLPCVVKSFSVDYCNRRSAPAPSPSPVPLTPGRRTPPSPSPLSSSIATQSSPSPSPRPPPLQSRSAH